MDCSETAITPALFGGAEVTLLEFDPLTNAARAALDRFLALPPQALDAVFPHVYAYYRDFHAAVGGDDWLDAAMGVPAGPEEIWRHVRPQSVTVSRQDDDGVFYVSLEAACDWEDEHGLNIVWRDGTDVVKVGSYDGHLTNEHAYDDARLHGVIYAATDPQWTTRGTR